MGQNNTTLNGAWDVTIGSTGTYVTGDVATVGYTRNSNGDVGGGSQKYKHAWWKYVPTTASSSVTATQNGSTIPVGNVYLYVYVQNADGTLSNVTNGFDPSLGVTFSVTAGTTYYLSLQGTDANAAYVYRLTVSGPSTAAPTHDSRSTPDNVIVVATGNTFAARPTPTDQLTTGTGDPVATYRSAWWKYTPAIAGTLTYKPVRVGGTQPASITWQAPCRSPPAPATTRS
jgi:hypothetical protein